MVKWWQLFPGSYRPLVKKWLGEAEVVGGVCEVVDVAEEVDVVLVQEGHERGRAHRHVVEKLLGIDDQLFPGFALQVAREKFRVCCLK